MPRFTKRKHTPQHDIKDDEDNAGQESSKEGNDSSTEQEEQDKANNQDNELVTDTIKSEHQQQQDDKIKQLQTILYPNNITNHWIKTKPTSDEHERHPQLKWYYTLQSSTTKLTCQFTVEGKIAKLFGADAISITLPQSLVKKWDKDSLNAAASLLDFYPGAKITDRTIPPRMSFNGELLGVRLYQCFRHWGGIPDIRYAIQAGPSYTFLDYIQEAGRGGRHGDPTLCMLVDNSQHETYEISTASDSISDPDLKQQLPMYVLNAFILWLNYSTHSDQSTIVIINTKQMATNLAELKFGNAQQLYSQFLSASNSLLIYRKILTTNARVNHKPLYRWESQQ
ncbi:hypothetical protein MP228_011113 [Amoeboaphelidium protococcarum]|nr:hypothetical protein MP228_011113 [Amoeboaphelidium protococcarum]